MPWREATEPVRMQRVAIAAPAGRLRDALVRVAEAGTVEVDRPGDQGAVHAATGGAGQVLQRMRTDTRRLPRLSSSGPDLVSWERDGRADLVAGETELESYAAGAVVRGEVAALAGWVPTGDLPALRDRLAEVGAAAVPLPRPRGVDPPTLLRAGGEVRRAFSPLVRTYGTVPYSDVDPTLPAGLAYVFMFGMMFGDVGHGCLLVLIGLMLRRGRPARLARFRPVWVFIVGAGLAAAAFGLLYGELFGPSGLVPVLWLAPLEEPVTLLSAGLAVGVVLLAGAYVVGTVNRWREGGWPLALSASSGVAGAALFAGLGVVALAVATGLAWLTVAGVLIALVGVVLCYIGFLAGGGGGAAGVTQATVEVFDAVVRLGSNVVSFARLAAFGLTHAALGLVVWDATAAFWRSGGLLVLASALVFVVGNALAFLLEALVAGIQALRLEYYELFSRVFTVEGRPFRPWHVPLETHEHAVDAGPVAASVPNPRRER
jgi:V/A-type H+-transporting ATPase subunit I